MLLEIGEADTDETPAARDDESILDLAVTQQVHIHEGARRGRVHGEKPELGLVVVAGGSRQSDVGTSGAGRRLAAAAVADGAQRAPVPR